MKLEQVRDYIQNKIDTDKDFHDEYHRVVNDRSIYSLCLFVYPAEAWAPVVRELKGVWGAFIVVGENWIGFKK